MMKPGEKVRWRSLNGDYTGTVESITPRGALVRLDTNGKHILLTPISREKDTER